MENIEYPNWSTINVTCKEDNFYGEVSKYPETETNIEAINFLIMPEYGLRIFVNEDGDGDGGDFAVEISRKNAIHLAKQILLAFEC